MSALQNIIFKKNYEHYLKVIAKMFQGSYVF